MVHLVFKGARLEFLTEQMPFYIAAVANGTTKEFLQTVYARYAKRFPINMPLDVDPSEEALAVIDDDAPEPESEPEHEHDLDSLSEEEQQDIARKVSERQALIQKRKKQIATWYYYRHMKSTSVDPRSSDPSNPYAALLFAATGKTLTDKPRQKSAINCWSKTQTENINILVRQACIQESVNRKNGVAVWNRIARQEFSKLSADVQQEWERKAKADHAMDIERWNASRTSAASTAPVDRQRAIEGLVHFMQPLLEQFSEATGWKLSLLAGGPEPIRDGRLCVISLHAGTTNGEAKLNFGQKERDLYLSQILPVFSKFLRACYTPEECRRRALTAPGNSSPLDEDVLGELGISFDPACSREDSMELSDTRNDPANPAPIPPATSSAHTTTSEGSTLTASAPAPTSKSTPATTSESTPATTSESTPATTSESTPATTSGPATTSEPAVQPSMATSTMAPNSGLTSIPSPPVSVMPSPLGSPMHSPSRRGKSITPPASPTPSSRPPSVSAALASINTENSPVGDASATHVVMTDSTRSRKRRQSVPAPDGLSAKRRRDPVTIASLLAAALPTVDPEGKWFKKSVDMMHDDSLGESWIALVESWIAFETKSGDMARGSLPAKGRPSAVYDWIQRARNPSYRPNIADSKAFGDKHIAWWTSFQPAWRISEDGELIREANGDVDDLRRPGANGLLSALASLFFWGSAVKMAGKKSKRWVESVADLAYVIERLDSSA